MGSHELKLDTVVSVCVTLDNLLSKSYGPNALNVLLSTSSGKLMVSSAGMSILQALNISHPIGHMLISSVQSHHRMTGDNSKSFLLLVCEILKNIQRTMPKDKNVDRIKYCKYLTLIKNTILPNKTMPILVGKCAKAVQFDELNSNVSDLLRTFLQGKVNHQTRENFTHLLTHYILEACNSCTLQEALQFTLDNFTFIFQENVGLSQLGSKAINGIVVTRDVMQNSSSGLKLEDVNFVFMACSLELKDSTVGQNAVFTGLQRSTMHKALVWKQQHVKKYMERLKGRSVKLLLTTVHISEMVLHLCSAVNIKVVHCVDEDEMVFLSKASNVPIIHESQDILEDGLYQYIGHADSFQNIVVAGKRCILLTDPKYIGPENNGIPNRPFYRSRKLCPLNIVQSVLVCALTPGMCSQFASVMYNAIKCLYMWADPVNILETTTAGTEPRCCGESDVFDNSTTETGNADKQKGVMSYSICGGGAFELFLYRGLKNRMAFCYDTQLQEVLNILSDSLLAVPLRLLQNSFSPSANRMNIAQLLKLTSPVDTSAQPVGGVSQNSSPHAYESMEAKVAFLSNRIVGIDSKTGTTLLEPVCGVVQPLASKVLMLYQVLDIVIQILRIDSVVSVKQHCPDYDTSDEEN